VGCVGPHAEAEFHARAPLILFTERSDEAVVHHGIRVWPRRTLIRGALPAGATRADSAARGAKLLSSGEVHTVGDRDFGLGIGLQRPLDVHL